MGPEVRFEVRAFAVDLVAALVETLVRLPGLGAESGGGLRPRGLPLGGGRVLAVLHLVTHITNTPVRTVLVYRQVALGVGRHFRHRLLLDSGEVGEDARHHVRRGLLRGLLGVVDRLDDHRRRRGEREVQRTVQVVFAVGHLDQTLSGEVDLIHGRHRLIYCCTLHFSDELAMVR